MPLPPDRPASHDALDLEAIWELGEKIDEAAPDSRVTPALLAEVAASAGVPTSHAYVACSIDPSLEWVRTHAVTVHACTGGCQAWGAVPLLERVLAERDARAADGRPGFDVAAHGCLNTCTRAPVLFSTGPHGTVGHPEMTVDQVSELVRTLVDG